MKHYSDCISDGANYLGNIPQRYSYLLQEHPLSCLWEIFKAKECIVHPVIFVPFIVQNFLQMGISLTPVIVSYANFVPVT